MAPFDMATVRRHEGWEALLAGGESVIRAEAGDGRRV
jgi:hypothetical protein